MRHDVIELHVQRRLRQIAVACAHALRYTASSHSQLAHTGCDLLIVGRACAR
jgi:hypothetical protein